MSTESRRRYVDYTLAGYHMNKWISVREQLSPPPVEAGASNVKVAVLLRIEGGGHIAGLAEWYPETGWDEITKLPVDYWCPLPVFPESN